MAGAIGVTVGIVGTAPLEASEEPASDVGGTEVDETDGEKSTAPIAEFGSNGGGGGGKTLPSGIGSGEVVGSADTEAEAEATSGLDTSAWVERIFVVDKSGDEVGAGAVGAEIAWGVSGTPP